jgi:two-component system copper resistance phosphate regulon response regulator CusR
VVKPFAFSELLARVRSLLRRTPTRRDKLRIDDLEIDTRHQRAERGGIQLNLTPKEFLLLAHLMHSAGEVVSRDEISSRIYDFSAVHNSNIVDVYVGYIRKKLERGGRSRLVHTRRGFGYVLEADSP